MRHKSFKANLWVENSLNDWIPSVPSSWTAWSCL